VDHAVVASGKLTLLGEYGVREGGPILVAAIDRHAKVAVRPADGAGIRYSSPADGVHPVRLEGRADDSSILLVQAVTNSTRGYLSSRGKDIDELSIELDAAGFYKSGQHLGLGSGGASAVGVAAALLLAAEEPIDGPARRWDLLTLAAHASSVARGASASGSDVAAAVYGGTVAYRRGGAIREVTLPDDLHWACVHSPGPSTTGSMLFRVPGDSGAVRSRIEPILEELAASSERAVDRLEESAARFIEEVREFRNLSDRLGHETGAATISPGMHKVGHLCERHGVVAKPTPTGGPADLGVLFSDDAEALDAALAACAEEGFEHIPLALDREGVRQADVA
jgi:mevalonate kinase